ncbi:hypothetical protein CGCS363_v003167 [Colletotrichum siamense]|uniref:uncharacterized protein n=1 Tax=Colletotrichum siamense TaxID=690259 RepID=UPI001872569A|nr:uncharacterized protein CGCS363_v003167 [Colletotrichum siamense]KAF5511161.1 hypothetical protein CGCS363_v003167 [Colletotrichum siamense]
MASINASGIQRKEAEEVAMMVFGYLVKHGTRLDATTLRKFAQEDIKVDKRQNVSYLNEDEIDIRRRYISDIQEILLADASFNFEEEHQELFRQARFWALLWTTGIDELRYIHHTLCASDPQDSNGRLKMGNDLEQAVLNAGQYGGYGQVGEKEANISRDPKKAKDASDRDGNKCVATGCNKFQVCHLAAFFGANRESAIGRLLHCMQVLIGPQAFRDLMKKLTGTKNKIDDISNMVTLTHKLHTYMDDAIFGLKPVGYTERRKPESSASSSESHTMNSEPATDSSHSQGQAECSTSAGLQTADQNVAVSMKSPCRRSERFLEKDLKRKAEAEAEADRTRAREKEKKAEEGTQYGLKVCAYWLPKTDLRAPWDKVEDFSVDPRERMREWSAENYEFRSESGRPLNSGTIITIWADKKEDLPDWGIMEFIFNALCFHRLCGGADPRVYRPWTDYDEDDHGLVYSADPRMEAERRILQILAEDDQEGGVYDAERQRKVQERMVKAVAELEITHAEAVSSNTPSGSCQAEGVPSQNSTESREVWVAPHLRHKHASDDSSASSKGSGKDQDEQQPAAPRD